MTEDEERKSFEKWWEEDAYPCEWSSWYLRDVVFKREEDGDWYADEKIQAAWDGWKGRAGISS
jgi:hypothetical protein